MRSVKVEQMNNTIKQQQILVLQRCFPVIVVDQVEVGGSSKVGQLAPLTPSSLIRGQQISGIVQGTFKEYSGNVELRTWSRNILCIVITASLGCSNRSS